MTIAVAWIRKTNEGNELVFVSDSRISGDGRTFDACPKILTLPRSDCAIAFAGNIGVAYPMMQQLALAIDAHAPARRRALDLTTLKTHALKVFDIMAGEIRVSPNLHGLVDALPGVQFLFGGYDWIKKDFELWSVVYSEFARKFVAHPPRTLVYIPDAGRFALARARDAYGQCVGRAVFAGDQASLAERKLIECVQQKAPRVTNLNWEPFEVVRDMLRDPARSETIGGAPQIARVFQYMSSDVQGVYWPNRQEGHIHLQGRPCLPYERIENYVFDPDTLRSEGLLLPVRDGDDLRRANADAVGSDELEPAVP